MERHVVFVDRPEIRIDDRWIHAGGRRVPIAALREVMIVEGAPDSTVHAVALSAVIISIAATMVAMRTDSLPVRLMTPFVIALAFVASVCTRRLRPPPVSLEVRCSGRTEHLITAANATFVNQVGRAMIRACEWNDVKPAMYRAYDPRTTVTLLMLHILAAGLFTAFLALASLLRGWA
jgi:hypothetical protein